MKISTMHTEGGPMIGVGNCWMNTTAAQKLAGDIYRAVIDAHRTEGEAYRHEMTPNYLEYPDRPTFDESADMDPCMLRGSHE